MGVLVGWAAAVAVRPCKLPPMARQVVRAGLAVAVVAVEAVAATPASAALVALAAMAIAS